MHQERRRAHRHAFVTNAEAADSFGVRVARVKDLSIAGAYLAMTNPFSKGAVILVTIRTKTEFFQCHATVAHSTYGLGMGVEFSDISPPFQNILEGWLLGTMQQPPVPVRSL